MPPLSGDAAVGHVDLVGDVGRGIAREVDRGGRDRLRFVEAVYRDRCKDGVSNAHADTVLT